MHTILLKSIRLIVTICKTPSPSRDYILRTQSSSTSNAGQTMQCDVPPIRINKYHPKRAEKQTRSTHACNIEQLGSACVCVVCGIVFGRASITECYAPARHKNRRPHGPSKQWNARRRPESVLRGTQLARDSELLSCCHNSVSRSDAKSCDQIIVYGIFRVDLCLRIYGT